MVYAQTQKEEKYLITLKSTNQILFYYKKHIVLHRTKRFGVMNGAIE